MKATDAVDPLIKAAEKQLPIKSRANNARIAAMRALVKIGDKRAVPTLMKILTTSADEQDFLLNQKAALGLAEFRDPQAIPALIKGLFMTGRGDRHLPGVPPGAGAHRRAGDRSAGPAAPGEEPRDPGDGEEAEVRGAATHPGVVPYKAAILLGDLRAKKAVPALIARLHRRRAAASTRSA